jgi:hypothetical protein
MQGTIEVVAAVGLLAWIALLPLFPGATAASPLPMRMALGTGVAGASAVLALSPRALPYAIIFFPLLVGALWLRGTPAAWRRRVSACFSRRRRLSAAAGVEAEFPELAALVLLSLCRRRGMSPAEAAVVASRCRTLDDVAAQAALRLRGFGGYAAYIRRYGSMIEVADPDLAAHGDRFPGGSRGDRSMVE